MYQGQTVFSQVMGFLPQNKFRQCVNRYSGNYRVRSFTCYDQLLCMAFAQLTYRESLRDIECCLRAMREKLYHVGIRGKVSRSTLADANEARDWRIYSDFAQILIDEARRLYIDDDFGLELEETVYALDSSKIDLCLVDKSTGVKYDQTVALTGFYSKKDYPEKLRRIKYYDAEKARSFVFLTNQFTLPPLTIAELYRYRWRVGVSSKGHIIQSVQVRPGLKGSDPVAWEAPWRESKMVKPSDTIFRKETMQGFRPQRAVNAEVASSHSTPVAETVYNARRQQASFETSLKRRRSPAGYQRWHVAKDYVSTGEALGVRRRNLVEEAIPITVSGKWDRRRQGGGLGCSTVDRCAAKRTRRKGPRPVNTPFVCREAGAR